MLHKLNLMDWRQNQLYRRKHLLYGRLILGGFLLSVGQGGTFFWMNQQLSLRRQSELALNVQIKKQKLSLHDWEQQQEEAVQDQKLLDQMNQWIAQSQVPVWLMSFLTSSTPSGIYLEEIRLQEQQVIIQGVSRYPENIAHFIQRLRQAPSVQQLDILSVRDNSPHWGNIFRAFQLRFVIKATSDKAQRKEVTDDDF
ncbi:PilN domain-containing protein [Vibrio mangrovi]|uniref:Fimbrial assembly protein (PilN) n=1 Tax=Vibrio mangrovi TaxID=474394 RepID=A0A1Y6IX66_9VIBR|nr:PilN domain-containing protein [Vibrio mangrovi]MDW6002737.1 PilN domain-containing protein [Vibrio mangrovi]SMS02228.1 Fimbrial assembly protein (PilN) [Vibrio mangrovi]